MRELLGIRVQRKFNLSRDSGYEFLDNYEVILKAQYGLPYEVIKFEQWYSDCSSGWTSATGSVVTDGHSHRVGQLHWVPKILPVKAEFVDDCKVILESGETLLEAWNGDDEYYPTGGVKFNPNRLIRTNRPCEKVKIFLVKGKPTVGKSTLFPEALELESFGRGAVPTAVEIVKAGTAILAPWNSYKEIEATLKESPSISENIEIVRVTLK